MLAVEDFRIGQDTLIFSKSIRIYDCDQYTREFYDIYGRSQPSAESCVMDNFESKTVNKWIPQKDHFIKDYMEHKLGGGRGQPLAVIIIHQYIYLQSNPKSSSWRTTEKYLNSLLSATSLTSCITTLPTTPSTSEKSTILTGNLLPIIRFPLEISYLIFLKNLKFEF